MEQIEGMFEQVIADGAQRHSQLVDLQRRMRSISAEVTSHRNVLTVEVGPGGELRDLRFNNREYRDMGPKDLAKLITDTIGKARDEVRSRTEDELKPTFGVDKLPDMFAEDFEWSSLMPPGFAAYGEQAAPKRGTRRSS